MEPKKDKEHNQDKNSHGEGPNSPHVKINPADFFEEAPTGIEEEEKWEEKKLKEGRSEENKNAEENPPTKHKGL